MKLSLLVLLISLACGALLQAQTKEELFSKGMAFSKEYRTAEAVAAFLEAEKKDPNDIAVILEIAKHYAYLIGEQKNKADGKVKADLAMYYAKRAYDMDPNRWETNFGMAVAYGKLAGFMNNKQKVAIAKTIKVYADKAVVLNPDSDYAHHVIARWNQELASMGAFKRTLANTFFGGLPEGSYETAVAEYELAIKLRPDRLCHYIEYGRTLILMGRKEEGKKALAKGLAMPNSEYGDADFKVRGRQALDDA